MFCIQGLVIPKPLLNFTSNLALNYSHLAAFALAAISAVGLIFVMYQKYLAFVDKQAALLVQKQLQEEENQKKIQKTIQENEKAALKLQQEEFGDESDFNFASHSNQPKMFAPSTDLFTDNQNQDHWQISSKVDSFFPLETEDEKKKRQIEEDAKLAFHMMSDEADYLDHKN